MIEAAIGLGSNVGNKADNLDRAADALGAAPGVTLRARSSNFRTEPWGVTDQDWFVNGCVLVETTLSARALLELCLSIEHRLGRVRDRHWGPRLIDLDILYYGEEAIDEPGLHVPHPHLLDRAFVLAPLNDLAPDKKISGITISDALARHDLSGIYRMKLVDAAE